MGEYSTGRGAPQRGDTLSTTLPHHTLLNNGQGECSNSDMEINESDESNDGSKAATQQGGSRQLRKSTEDVMETCSSQLLLPLNSVTGGPIKGAMSDNMRR